MTTFATLLQKSLANNPGLENKFISLAAVSLNPLRPSVRTVVFRGFYKESQLIIYTDAHSTKVKELEKNGNVEICWYFRDTREQYRIKGIAKFLDDQDYKQQCWSTMSPSAKELYLQVLETGGNQQSQKTLMLDASTEEMARNRFVILAIDPNQVEYLDLMKRNALPVKL